MKNKRILPFGFAILLVAIVAARMALAGSTYTTRETIPGQGTTDSFPDLLQNIYNFSIGAAAILAMIMIGVGAFLYIVTSAGNASKMANAKDMIFSAIFGLVIAMVAWITLFLINPDLVVGNIDAIRRTNDPGFRD